MQASIRDDSRNNLPSFLLFPQDSELHQVLKVLLASSCSFPNISLTYLILSVLSWLTSTHTDTQTGKQVSRYVDYRQTKLKISLSVCNTDNRRQRIIIFRLLREKNAIQATVFCSFLILYAQWRLSQIQVVLTELFPVLCLPGTQTAWLYYVSSRFAMIM